MRDADRPVALAPGDALRDHLSELLNYNFCGSLGDLENVFDLRDGGYGYALRVGVPAIECLVDGERLCAQVIDAIIRACPMGYTCQIVRRTTSNIRRQMETYASVETVGQLAEAFAQARLDQFAHAVQHGFVPDNEELNFYPGTEELYIFISTPDFGRLSLDKLLRGQAHIDSQVQDFRSCIAAVKDLLRSVNLVHEPLTGATFTQYVVSLLNPRLIEETTYTPKILGDELPEAISKAVTLEELDSKQGFVSVYNGTRTHFRCVSMVWQPDGVEPGMLDEVVARERDCAFVLTVRVLDTRSVQLGLKTKRYLSSRMRMGSVNAEEIDAMEASIGEALGRAVNGERFVDARLCVLVTDRTGQAVEDRAARIRALLARCGMEYTDIERDIGTSLILNGCLPFPRGDYERAFQRSRRMLSADVAELMPVGGTWAGTMYRPYALYPNRAGRPFLLNPLASPGNSNFVVVAASGSGKSFWNNDFMTQTARLPGAMQFIVSVKPDYRKYATLFGKEVDLSLENCPSISPFWGPPTNDAIDLWTAIVLGMVKEDPTQPAGTEIKQTVSAAVTRAAHGVHAAGSGEAELQLTDIQLQLSNLRTPVGDKLATALYDYVDQGRFARLFAGPSAIKPGANSRTFFNLRGIMSTDAGATALMCVMRSIDAVMVDERLRGIPKIVIFDEGWSLLAMEFGAAFIDRAVRTYRSLGGSVGFVTQDPRDLDTPMGRAVLANSATKIVLPMEKAASAALPRFMDLNAAEVAAINSLNMRKGVFSEFFVRMSGVGSTVVRLTPFPLMYALNTTAPEDEAVQLRMLQEGMSCDEMIERFATNFPRGVAESERQTQAAF